jgi:hypothetical protein
MSDNRYTATQIADLLADALEYQDSAKSNMHHRVRYLAKKSYLAHGKSIDNRGTLDFPVSEVYRAAVFCEFLGMSMDMKIAASALQRAESLHLGPNMPESARVEGGWQFSGGLAAAVRGVNAGENWKLFVVLKRSGHSTDAGLHAFYTWSEEARESIDELYGRNEAATKMVIDLTRLFKNLVCNVGLI